MIGETPQVAQYDRFELTLAGPAEGNPFVEVELGARFEHDGRAMEAGGFYDGGGIYRIRFMPDAEGLWRYLTTSNCAELDGHEGHFVVGPARPGIHGPVRVWNTFHFRYADGTPYVQMGTTCYAWTHQGTDLEAQTLETLASAPFNKLRMCVFPKHYRFNHNEPEHYPFERLPDGGWDFARFNPAFFHHFEHLVDSLRALGIEADIILLHPYDRWGFADMGEEADLRYLRHVVARLASFSNVWWSLANEYNLMRTKAPGAWDRYFQAVQQADPYDHLRSVHNWQRLDVHDWEMFYDHARPWVTHCSIQHGYLDLVGAWRTQYGKPVVVDECFYEGDLPNGWGNITAEEMVRRFWEGTFRGGYVGHGETYLDPDEVIWWSKGGALRGGSPERIAFLRRLLEDLPPGGLDPQPEITDTHLPSAGQAGRFYLVYFGWRQPAEVTLKMPDAGAYRVDIIDTWNMTIEPQPGSFRGTRRLVLPRRPYMAVLARAVGA
jgi:hypothetical protein